MRGLAPVLLCACPPGCGASRTVLDGGAGSDGDVDSDVDADSDGDADAGPCVDPDADRDGFVAVECGGDDCDDSRRDVRPGALDGAQWRVERVDDDGGGLAMAIGSDGTIQIVYAGADGLVRARGTFEDWTFDVVDEDGAGPSSFALGPDGDAHVVYGVRADAGDGWTSLYHATDATGEWRDETVVFDLESAEAGVGVADDGTIYVAYWEDDEARLATKAPGGGWDRRTVEASPAARGPALALGPDGAPHVAYRFRFWDRPDEVRVAVLRDAAFEIETVSDVGGNSPTDLAVSGATVHATLGVTYATNATGAWRTETPDPFAIHGLALAVDSTGRPHVAGTTHAQGDFRDCARYAVRDDDGWRAETIPAACKYADQVDIAVDPDDVPHVAIGSGPLYHAFREPMLDGVDQDCDGEDG